MNVPGMAAIRTRIGVIIGARKTAPVSPSTSGGVAVISQPPVIEAPQNIQEAVRQSLNNSPNLRENTITGAGIGNSRTSLPRKVVKTPRSSYIALALLGGALLLAVAWDRGKL